MEEWYRYIPASHRNKHNAGCVFWSQLQTDGAVCTCASSLVLAIGRDDSTTNPQDIRAPIATESCLTVVEEMRSMAQQTTKGHFDLLSDK
jgi:hypothetical protein